MNTFGAPGNILAFTAVALGLERRFALGHLAHLPTIASAFQFHGVLPLGLHLH